MWVKLAEGDVISGVHDNGDDVVLAYAHGGRHAVRALVEDAGLHDLWGEVLGVGVEVSDEAVEVGGGGSGGEGCPAPVVEHRAGVFDAIGRRNAFDDQTAAMQRRLRGGGGEEVAGGAVLLRQAGLYGPYVGVEGGERGWGGFGEQPVRGLE